MSEQPEFDARRALGTMLLWVAVVPILLALAALIPAFWGQIAWNQIAPLTGSPEVTYWQAWGACVLVSIVSGCLRGWHQKDGKS